MEKRQPEEVTLARVFVVLAVGLGWIPMLLVSGTVLFLLLNIDVGDYIRWIIGVTMFLRAGLYFLGNREKSGVVYSLVFLAGTLYFYLFLKWMFDGFLADSPWSA